MSEKDEWTETRLKYLFTSTRNGVWGDDPNGVDDVFCVRGTDFDRVGNRVSVTKLPRRSVLGGVLRDHKLNNGDLIIEKSGGSADHPVGSVALFDLEIQAVCSNFNARMQVANNADPRFICYLMNGLYWSGFTRRYVKQTTGIQNLDTEEFLSQPCKLPQLAEQRRISDFLDAETGRIDRAINQRRSQLTLVEERYKTFISEIVTPGISSTDDMSDAWPWLPKSIHTIRLGYLARVQSGVTVHNAREKSHEDDSFPYLRVANVQGELLDLSDVKEIVIPTSMARRSMLVPGDVVMTEANGNPDNLGRGAVWRGEIPNMVHQNHVFAIRANQEYLLPEYISALLASAHGRRYFRFTSTQVGIATTSSFKVLDFPVPKIPISRQQVAVELCERERLAADRVTGALGRQLALLTERRQALITAAVTGQIDVTISRGLSDVDGGAA